MTAPALAAREVPQHFVLGTRDVEVCWATLDVAPARLESLQMTLPAEERREGERHRCDPQRFIAARGLVREILGKRLGIDPARLVIGRTAAGKPFLVGSGGSAASLQFNLSHAGEWLLVAMSPDAAVGVDVERCREDVDTAALARHMFSVEERVRLETLRHGERRVAFFSCWARKEAGLKAIGTGFAIAPESLDAGMGAAPSWLRFAGADWCVRGIPTPRPDLVAAIAVRA